MKASGTSAPITRVTLLRLTSSSFKVHIYAYFSSEWNPRGRSTIRSLTSLTLMVYPLSFILLIFTHFVFLSRSSLFKMSAHIKVLSLPLFSNAYVDVNFPPFGFTLTGTIWRNTAWCFAVLDIHAFVFSSSVPSTFFLK